MARHRAASISRPDEAERRFQKNINAATMEKIQKPITVMHVLFKVTTCLYLRPSNKARSLSTLIAVNVTRDTEPEIT